MRERCLLFCSLPQCTADGRMPPKYLLINQQLVHSMQLRHYRQPHHKAIFCSEVSTRWYFRENDIWWVAHHFRLTFRHRKRWKTIGVPVTWLLGIEIIESSILGGNPTSTSDNQSTSCFLSLSLWNIWATQAPNFKEETAFHQYQ